MHFPQGVIGWTVFMTGLMVVAYRIHGIDAPRTWIEWMEREFVFIIPLRFIGGILLLLSIALGYFGGLQQTPIGNLFVLCVTIIGLLGFGLLVLQNHTRHIIFATAEASDTVIRYVSIVVVLIGMALTLAPFML